MLQSFASFTSDMGPEGSLPSFNLVDFATVMPPWLRSQRMYPDAGGPVHQATHCAQAAIQPSCPSTMLATALPIPGILHVCSNAAQDIHHALTGWDTFYTKLKTLEKFLCNRGRLDRFLAKCTDYGGGPGTVWAKALHKKFHPAEPQSWQQDN